MSKKETTRERQVRLHKEDIYIDLRKRRLTAEQKKRQDKVNHRGEMILSFVIVILFISAMAYALHKHYNQ